MEPARNRKGSGSRISWLEVMQAGVRPRRELSVKELGFYCVGMDLPLKGFKQDGVITHKMGSKHLL